MATYNGRRGLNFSQYLENLNAIPNPVETQEQPFDLDAELALFTNTEFFDFDNMATLGPAGTDFGVVGFEPQDKMEGIEMDGTETPKAMEFNDTSAAVVDEKPVEAATTEYNFPQNFEFNPSMLPLQSAPGSAYPPPPSTTSGGFISPLTQSPLTSPPNGGDIRTHDALSHPGTAQTIEEAARRAAEEDKRRRNTAASARFRVKKKQREQTLERTVKEISDKNASLESRVNQLEMENRWLKNLLTDRNAKADAAAAAVAAASGSTASTTPPASDASKSTKSADSRQTSEERDVARKRPSTKKGVGTQAA